MICKTMQNKSTAYNSKRKAVYSLPHFAKKWQK
ncbi:hypothetical protein MHA_1276 [Mannheimia haemolytica PHL213]|nr:hypothetical protein MHA_1276 [Mannheimia haemolytica PHL213]